MRRRYFAIVAVSLTSFACTSSIFDDPTERPDSAGASTFDSSTGTPDTSGTSGTSGGGETASEGETTVASTSGDSGSGSSTGGDATTSSDGCANCPRRYIFVTEGAWNGSLITEAEWNEWDTLDGVARANRRCRESAARNGLFQQMMMDEDITFMAWIGVGEPAFEGPAQLLPNVDASYVLPNSTVVAGSWSELTAGMLRAPINVTEMEMPVEKMLGRVWTNVRVGGEVKDDYDCHQWTSGGLWRVGPVGNAQAIDSAWTDDYLLACHETAHLYCVEVRCGQTPCE